MTKQASESRTLEGLKKRHVELSGALAEKGAALRKAQERLSQLPPLLVAATGKEHSDLVREYGEAEAGVKILQIEVDELRRQVDTAWIEILDTRCNEAREAYESQREKVVRPTIQAREEAAANFRVARNRHLSLEEVERRRLGMEEAESKYRLAIAEAYQLKNVWDRAQATLEAAIEPPPMVG